MMGFYNKMEGNADFDMIVIQYHNGQITKKDTTEGIAILYDEKENKLVTTGMMSNKNLEKALFHVMKAIIISQLQDNNPLQVELYCASLLDKLDEFIDNEVIGNNGLPMADNNKKGE